MLHHYFTAALRHFFRHRLTTGINLLCLAMGLVCFIVAYGVVSYFDAGDLYHHDAARTYVITQSVSVGKTDATPTLPRTSFAVAKFLKADVPSLEYVARASAFGDTATVAVDNERRFAKLSFADADFLKIFDLPFVRGDSRAALGQPQSIVLSSGLARQLFGDKNPLGRAMLIDGKETVYVRGVVGEPRQPSHLSTTNTGAVSYFDALVSMDVHEAMLRAMKPEGIANHRLNVPTGFMSYTTYVVLPEHRERLVLSQLEEALRTFSARHVSNNINAFKTTLGVRPINELVPVFVDSMVGTDRTGVPAIAVLLGLGLLVLCVATLNYANLTTAQLVARGKEVAMRRVLGAGAGQVAGQYFLEAALLTTAAVLLVIFGTLTVRPLLQGELRAVIELVLFSARSVTFWGFIAALIAGVSALASAYPALVLTRQRPMGALRRGRVTAGPRFVPALLVGVQFFAVSFLLVAVVVMSQQNERLQRLVNDVTDAPVVSITDNTRTLGLDLNAFRRELLQHPEIQAVSGTMFPLNVSANDVIRVSRTGTPDAQKSSVADQLVDHDFFATMGLKIIAGRGFDREHGQDESNPTFHGRVGAVVIDRDFAERLGFKEPAMAVGQTVYAPGLANGDNGNLPSVIIGVVESRPLYAFNMSGASGSIYQLVPSLVASPLIRISPDRVQEALAIIERVWREQAPDTALHHLFLDEQFNSGLRPFATVTSVFGRLAAFALAIASIGLVGMATHIVGRRLHEIGVRKTLGATVSQILSLLLRDFARPVLVANVIAWPFAYFAARLYLNLFVDQVAVTPLPFILSLTVTLAIAWAALSAHAWRAARVNPATVLRYE